MIYNKQLAKKLGKRCINNKVYACTLKRSISMKKRDAIYKSLKHDVLSVAGTSYKTSYYTHDVRDRDKFLKIINS